MEALSALVSSAVTWSTGGTESGLSLPGGLPRSAGLERGGGEEEPGCSPAKPSCAPVVPRDTKCAVVSVTQEAVLSLPMLELTSITRLEGKTG